MSNQNNQEKFEKQIKHLYDATLTVIDSFKMINKVANLDNEQILQFSKLATTINKKLSNINQSSIKNNLTNKNISQLKINICITSFICQEYISSALDFNKFIKQNKVKQLSLAKTTITNTSENFSHLTIKEQAGVLVVKTVNYLQLAHKSLIELDNYVNLLTEELSDYNFNSEYIS